MMYLALIITFSVPLQRSCLNLLLWRFFALLLVHEALCI